MNDLLELVQFTLGYILLAQCYGLCHIFYLYVIEGKGVREVKLYQGRESLNVSYLW